MKGSLSHHPMHQCSMVRYFLRRSHLCEVVQSHFLSVSPWSSPVAVSIRPSGRTCGLFSVVVPVGQPGAVTLPGMMAWWVQSLWSGGSLSPQSTGHRGHQALAGVVGAGPLSNTPRCLQRGVILLPPAVAQVLPTIVKELDSERLTFVLN